MLVLAVLGGCASVTDEVRSTTHRIQRKLPGLLEGPEALPEGTHFAFLYFKDDDAGLYAALSTDGYTWTEANAGRPLMVSQIWLRDPSVTRGPDGTYHLVFTAGGPDAIGYASSPDLLTWTPARAIRVMQSIPGTTGTWAPEVVHDPAENRFVIAWSSHVEGRFEETKDLAIANHRLYATATRDFQTFEPPRLLLDPGFPVIDAAFVQTGSEWRLFFKDERDKPDKKQLRTVAGPTPLGPWGRVSDALSIHRVEAPCVLRVGSRHIVYFDEYRWGSYGAIRTRDFFMFEDVSGLMSFPPRARHGTFIQIPPETARRLGAPAP